MAAPVADKIQLPLDTGNTGKKVRTQTRTVGADTVHEHFYIQVSARSKLGVYHAATTPLTEPTGVHNGTTTGHFWLINPIGSTVKLSLRRLQTWRQFNAIAVDTVAGDFRFSLCTFTGTASGATITPAKHDSNDAAAQGSIRTASTGLTVTLGATIRSEEGPHMGLATGGAGSFAPALMQGWDPDEDGQVVLRAGEGIVYWSALALTTANRRTIVNFTWEEFE